MNTPLSPHQRAMLALDLLAQPRRAAPHSRLAPLPDAPALAREVATHAKDLSHALATVVQTGDATAQSTHVIAQALGAQHTAVRQVLGLSKP